MGRAFFDLAATPAAVAYVEWRLEMERPSARRLQAAAEALRQAVVLGTRTGELATGLLAARVAGLLDEIEVALRRIDQISEAAPLLPEDRARTATYRKRLECIRDAVRSLWSSDFTPLPPSLGQIKLDLVAWRHARSSLDGIVGRSSGSPFANLVERGGLAVIPLGGAHHYAYPVPVLGASSVRSKGPPAPDLDRVRFAAVVAARWGGPCLARMAADGVYALGELRTAGPLVEVLRDPASVRSHRYVAAALGLLDTEPARRVLAEHIEHVLSASTSLAPGIGAGLEASVYALGPLPPAVARTTELQEFERGVLERATQDAPTHRIRETARCAIQAWEGPRDCEALLER